jgi:hypothetical protein
MAEPNRATPKEMTAIGGAAGAAGIYFVQHCLSRWRRLFVRRRSGGECGPGALAGGISAAASPVMPRDFVGGLAGNVAVGGLASVAGGGKFANGAVTGAFGYLYNECGNGGCWESDGEYALRAAGNVDGYWSAKCDAGEPFTCTALGVVRNNTILGKAANAWLRIISTVLNVQVNPADISIDLTNRYGNYQQTTSSEVNPQWPSASAITIQHHQTFQQFGLPPYTFGATPFISSGWMMPTSRWCEGCAP